MGTLVGIQTSESCNQNMKKHLILTIFNNKFSRENPEGPLETRYFARWKPKFPKLICNKKKKKGKQAQKSSQANLTFHFARPICYMCSTEAHIRWHKR